MTPNRDELVPDGDESCPWCGNAALLLAGLLPADEQTRFLDHVESCTACSDELQASRAVVAGLDAALVGSPGVLESPPTELRDRLLAAIRARPRAPATPAVPATSAAPATPSATEVQSWKRWTHSPAVESAPGLATLRAGEGGWEQTGVRGVSVRSLAVDAERRYVTMLVRMEPGAAYPAHRHAGAEECLVLAGELSVGGTTLRPGDYQRAEAGSTHGIQRSERGCTLFIVSSQDDELLATAR